MKRALSQASGGVVLLAEEADKCEQTQEILKMQGFAGDILYYKTKPGSPVPQSGEFTLVYLGLKTLGVSELVVAGQYGNYLCHPLQTSVNNKIVFEVSGKFTAVNVGSCVGGFIDGILEKARADADPRLEQIILSPMVMNGIKIRGSYTY